MSQTTTLGSDIGSISLKVTNARGQSFSFIVTHLADGTSIAKFEGSHPSGVPIGEFLLDVIEGIKTFAIKCQDKLEGADGLTVRGGS